MNELMAKEDFRVGSMNCAARSRSQDRKPFARLGVRMGIMLAAGLTLFGAVLKLY